MPPTTSIATACATTRSRIRDNNIERVDVLKGPSGALFGRGSKGGIVNEISKVPDAGLSPSVEAQWGTEETASLYADLPASLGDTVKLRLNLGGGIEMATEPDGTTGERCLRQRPSCGTLHRS